MLEKIIAEFDLPIQQVLIEARFITISEAAFLDLGFRWASSIANGAVKDQTGIQPRHTRWRGGDAHASHAAKRFSGQRYPFVD